MTDNQIKECLSEGFLRIILAQNKFKVYDSKYDHGVDLTVGPLDKIPLPKGKIMYQDSDRRLDIQLKCTTVKDAKLKNGFINYRLRNKNYIALKSKVDSPYIKMILVLLVLPEDKNTWINVVENEMLFKKHCYWYIPTNSIIESTNKLKGKDTPILITIPKDNHLLEDFESIFNKVNGI